MARLARMSDVARVAGVSTMTVSRAINHNPNVSDETRRRVFAAIEQLHYHRNELARSLREKRTRQIGLLVPNLFDPFFANCAHAIGVVAKQHNYSVIIATSNEDPGAEFEEAHRMLHRKVEGVLVIPAASAGPRSQLLSPEFDNLPIVALDRPLESKRYDTVLVQNRTGAEIGTRHLIGLGHKRIAFFGFRPVLYTMRTRLEGYCDAMLAAGLKPDVQTVTDALETSVDALRTLVAGKRPPTALFCANNLITQHVLHGLRALRVHLPQSMALVGFDDFDTADLLQPGITVVRQPTESLGRTAAEVLFARLEGKNEAPSKRIVLPVELIVRGSCGGRPSQGQPGRAHRPPAASTLAAS
jgi:LacI family transcriptional regulator